MFHIPDNKDDKLGDANPQTPEQARDITRGYLSARQPASSVAADAALLAVSELVTNAVRHAGGVTGFQLTTGPDTVTVSVSDASLHPPQPRQMKAGVEDGFGWHLLRELALDVQVRIHSNCKTISVVLPLPHEAGDHEGVIDT